MRSKARYGVYGFTFSGRLEKHGRHARTKQTDRHTNTPTAQHTHKEMGSQKKVEIVEPFFSSQQEMSDWNGESKAYLLCACSVLDEVSGVVVVVPFSRRYRSNKLLWLIKSQKAHISTERRGQNSSTVETVLYPLYLWTTQTVQCTVQMYSVQLAVQYNGLLIINWKKWTWRRTQPLKIIRG